VVIWLPQYCRDNIVVIRVESTEMKGDRRFIGDPQNVLNSSSLVRKNLKDKKQKQKKDREEEDENIDKT